MPTPEEVDAVGTIEIDFGGRLATVSRWKSPTFDGRAIAPGRWYHVLSSDGVTSYGMVNVIKGESYAYRPFEVGQGLGEVVGSLDEGLRVLRRDFGG